MNTILPRLQQSSGVSTPRMVVFAPAPVTWDDEADTSSSSPSMVQFELPTSVLVTPPPAATSADASPACIRVEEEEAGIHESIR